MNAAFRRAALAANIAFVFSTLVLVGLPPVAAAELDPAAVKVLAPEQFKWRDPTDQIATNQTILLGDPTKTGGLYININKFKTGRFGNAHYHPNDRFITVIAGAAWRGTGPVVDAANATRVPKGTFMIDHANKLHWDGTKEETGAYLISGIGPATNIETPKVAGPYAGGDPSAATIKLPQQIVWKETGGSREAVLTGDPDKPGVYVTMLTLRKGSTFNRPRSHPNDRYAYVLDGTWWLGTGDKVDPNQAVPAKAGSFVSLLAKGVHWDGAKDEDATIVFIGEGPATPTAAK
jgi:quercetin dioxygenase-like cupin family protein